MSVAKFIVDGLKLELNEKLELYVETGLDTTCAIGGEHISTGIPWKRIIPSSTAEYLDLMHGMAFQYLSISAAIAFKGSWNMASRLIFEDGEMHHPYIAAKSAAKSERPYWSELVRSVWPERKGENCLCIFAGDFKKKVWPMATTGPLGTNTPVLLFDPDRFVLKNLSVNWGRMIETLDFVEVVYRAGFNKRAIETGLYQCYAALVDHGSVAIEWESRLANMRDTPEFAVSILIAQKE